VSDRETSTNARGTDVPPQIPSAARLPLLLHYRNLQPSAVKKTEHPLKLRLCSLLGNRQASATTAHCWLQSVHGRVQEVLEVLQMLLGRVLSVYLFLRPLEEIAVH
jgi:hypothetical protein